MRIGKEQNVSSLKRTGTELMDKTSWEETRSKDTLDRKLKLEQGLIDKKEDLQKEINRQESNREELIKLRVKNS